MYTNYPKTKAAGVLNIISALVTIMAGAVIVLLLFTSNFRVVEEGAENGLDNLALIIIIPFTFIHIAVLFVSFLIQLIRGIKLNAASQDGDVGIASYIVTLVLKIICLAANVFMLFIYKDVAVGGFICIVVTAIASVITLFVMIFEFFTKAEILDED